jgi:NADH-quinone oxidoreductase subunit K
MTLTSCLLLAAGLFCIGLVGVLTRRNLVLVLVSIEIMLNAANLNFIAFWHYSPNAETWSGPIFALFSIGVAGAEAAVGLALVLAVYRHYRVVDVEQVNTLKG